MAALSVAVVLLKAYFSPTSASAGEGLWPIDALPKEKIREWSGIEVTEDWIRDIQRSCVRIAATDGRGGGSAAFVSPDGLIITNRHVILDALSALSTPDRDLVSKGFLAGSRDQELPCRGLEAQVLIETRDLTPTVKKFLKDKHGLSALRELRSIFRRTETPGALRKHIVSFYGGAQYAVHMLSQVEVRLVFVPDANWGRFGDEEDNFHFPRHSLDVAFLRAYMFGEPLRIKHYLRWSDQGVKEGSPIFVAGFPGMTDRRLPVAELRHMRDVALPLKVAVSREATRRLKALADSDTPGRLQAQLAYRRWSNRHKIESGTLALLRSEGYLEKRAEEEKKLRTDLAGHKEANGILGVAYEEVERACTQLSLTAPSLHFLSPPSSRLLGMARSLRSFAEATKGKPAEQVKRQTESFKSFVEHLLGPKSEINLQVDQTVLEAWFSAAAAMLPKTSPLQKTLTGGDSPEKAAARLFAGAENLVDIKQIHAALDAGAQGIEQLNSPLLAWLGQLDQYSEQNALDVSAVGELEAKREEAVATIKRAVFLLRGPMLPPDANGTLRLGWGRPTGYTESDGTKIPWTTTFQSMIDRARAFNGKPPHVLSDRFTAARERLDLSSPLNFVSTTDGAPGCSGAPVFDLDRKLVGLHFDGNRQATSRMHAFLEPESGARSISVHSTAILTALRDVYGAKELVQEIQHAAEMNRAKPEQKTRE